MNKGKGKLYIGTSGYVYSQWENGVFYPAGLSKMKQLNYYAGQFNTVEMNYPFYRLPSNKSFFRWYEATPKKFIFSVKVSRYITHIKRLSGIEIAWETFLNRALNLKEKLGPFLFQFPSNFKKNTKRLKELIKITAATDKKHGRQKYALEFRHQSWFSDDVYNIIRPRKNISICFADSPGWPLKLETTGNFIYLRMHGKESLYSSKYSKKELKEWANKIKNWINKKLNVYVYFNNDAMGYAPENAKELWVLCR